MNPRLAKAYLHVIATAAQMSLKMMVADAFIIFAVLFQPLIIALLGMWMLQGRGGDFAIFVVVGSGMTGLWSSLLFVSGNSITQERWTGTLEMLVGMPTPGYVIWTDGATAGMGRGAERKDHGFGMPKVSQFAAQSLHVV